MSECRLKVAGVGIAALSAGKHRITFLIASRVGDFGTVIVRKFGNRNVFEFNRTGGVGKIIPAAQTMVMRPDPRFRTRCVLLFNEFRIVPHRNNSLTRNGIIVIFVGRRKQPTHLVFAFDDRCAGLPGNRSGNAVRSHRNLARRKLAFFTNIERADFHRRICFVDF